MKICPDFKLREMCNRWIITPEGVGNIDYSELLSLNESAALLWKELEGKDFTPQDAAQIIMENYEGVDTETALSDVEEMLAMWRKKNLIIE